MKYTLYGFSQKTAIELGLSNDDLLFLRWFMDFKETGSMDRKYIPSSNNMGYWVAYSKISEDLPILFNGTKLGNNKKIQRMLSGNLSKVITRDFEKAKTKNGGKVYLTLVEDAVRALLTSNNVKESEVIEKECNPMDNNVQRVETETSIGYGHSCPEGMDRAVQSDISIIDTSIIDTSIINISSSSNSSNPLIDNLLEQCEKRRIELSREDIETLMALYDPIVVARAINKMLWASTKSFIKCPRTYIQTILDNASKSNQVVINKPDKPNNFNNFSQRNYDFEDLERKLLGWDDKDLKG